jgi:hypothetical protein
MRWDGDVAAAMRTGDRRRDVFFERSLVAMCLWSCGEDEGGFRGLAGGELREAAAELAAGPCAVAEVGAAAERVVEAADRCAVTAGGRLQIATAAKPW